MKRTLSVLLIFTLILTVVASFGYEDVFASKKNSVEKNAVNLIKDTVKFNLFKPNTWFNFAKSVKKSNADIKSMPMDGTTDWGN